MRTAIAKSIRLLTCVCAASLLAACATSPSSTDNAYKAALDAEAQRVSLKSAEENPDAETKELDVHFGFALQRGAVNKLIKRGLKAEFRRALEETPGSITIAGQEIPLRLNSDLGDVQLEADDSCPTCVRITGKVLGRFDVDFPLIKEDGEEAYESKFSVIAPLRFVAAEEGGVTLQLDTAQIAKLGGLFGESKIEGLPSKLQPIAQKGLDKIFSDKLLAKFEPIDLFGFGGVEFGVEGMKIYPSALSYDTKTKTIFAGVATNLSGIDGGIAPLESLGEDDAVAVSYHLQLISNVLSLKMQQGQVARHYDDGGTANPKGAARVIVTGLRRHQDDSETRSNKLALDFEVYRLGQKGKDQRSTATAYISLGGDAPTVERVEFSGGDASAKNLDTWKSADFLVEAASLVAKTTTMPRVDVPGTPLSVGTRLVEFNGQTLTAFGGLKGLTTAEGEPAQTE